MNVGPQTREQMYRLGRIWQQGQHILITGPTGSGKSTLARQVVDERIKRSGYVVNMIAKLQRDRTIDIEYQGWTRWKKWQRPHIGDNRILLWPDVSKCKTVDEMRKVQSDVFRHALDQLARDGRWTVQLDEGLYMADSKFMNLESHMAMLHQLGRSADLTLVTLSQRPSHLPLVIYSSASHAFIGRTREKVDRNRLAELGGREGSDELGDMVAEQGLHDFVWVPVAADLPAENVRLDL